MAVDEAGTIPGTPYQVTVTHSGTFVTDYGVIDTLTGTQLTKVASSPATGQYSVAAGVYTFAAADTTKTVKISYSYTDSTAGATITLANQLMGFAPEFRAFLFSAFRTKRLGIELYSCTMGQMTIPTKQEDFWMSDLTFDAGVDATDTLGKIYADVA
jgi:endoglucanase Acf2